MIYHKYLTLSNFVPDFTSYNYDNIIQYFSIVLYIHYNNQSDMQLFLMHELVKIQLYSGENGGVEPTVHIRNLKSKLLSYTCFLSIKLT